MAGNRRSEPLTVFSDHGYPDRHTVPHWHEVQWNAQYPIGGYKIDHRLDSNPPFDYKEYGRTD